jgi:Flp pilus assembly pilin Flp
MRPRDWLQPGRRPADDPSMGRPTLSRGRARDRGATLVEYALIISVFVFGSMGAIQRLDDKSGDYYTNASNDIGDLPQSGVDTSDNGSVPTSSSTTSTTSTTAAPTTTTTTTTIPTTTTTTTTTTTIPTTTTTTIPTRSTITELTNISDAGGPGDYNAIVRVRIRHNKTAAAIAGATVTFRMVDNSGSTTTKACTTDSTGRCSVTWNRADSRSPVTATVTGVSSSPTWDGVQASVLLPKP